MRLTSLLFIISLSGIITFEGQFATAKSEESTLSPIQQLLAQRSLEEYEVEEEEYEDEEDIHEYDDTMFIHKVKAAYGTRIGFIDAPYTVLILAGGGFKCTGAVIASTFVLTAAHCFLYSSGVHKNATIFYGRSDFQDSELHTYEKKIDALAVWMHPDFDIKKVGTPFHADIALVELVSSIVDDSDIVVNILTIGGAWPVDSSLNLLSMDCMVLGYGYDVKNLTVYYRDYLTAYHSHTDCNCMNPRTVCIKKPRPMFCAGHSAYPVLCENQIYGIASYNHGPKRCKAPRNYFTNSFCHGTFETIMTFTCPFLIWISDIVEEAVITSQPESCRAHISVSKSYIIYILNALIVADFICLTKWHF